jgi:Response regulator containing a CheY-like receiver domain and an HTH DNA-binding domain
MIRLVVFETYPLFHLGIKSALKDDNHIYVAGNAFDITTLFSLLTGTPEEVILLGVNPCDNNISVDVVRCIRHDYPMLKILAFADEGTEHTIRLMMKDGINGFIGKWQANCYELGKAIQQVASEEEYIGEIDRNKQYFRY